MVAAKKRKPHDPKLIVTLANWETVARLHYRPDSLEEVEAINVLQYLDADARMRFANGLWRALKVDCKAKIQVPHWMAAKYMDPDVAWPPLTEQWMYWLNKFWRDKNGYAHSGYDCNFHVMPFYNLHPLLGTRSQDFNQFAVQWYKEAAQDLVLQLTKYPMDKEP